MKGKVYLVGAGPGDPGLITVKGLELIQKADVILYDYLANPSLLQHASASCKKINVGKRKKEHTWSQEKIICELISQAKKGKCVVRLKGGDPTIFARGGEEALAMAEASIPFEIVPGVSSAIAVPAYAGIPLTHREISSEILIIPGHHGFKKWNDQKWEAIAQMDTLVFLMATSNLSENIRQLIHHGRSPQTPAALISWGSYPIQKTIIGTLETLSDQVQKANIQAPTIIVIGEVVKLRDQLNWFETKPLFGKKIVLTGAEDKNSLLKEKLTGLGAEVILFPVIKIKPIRNNKKLDRAIKKINDYHWLLFTSTHAVEIFWRGLGRRGIGRIKIACIGMATAQKLKSCRLPVHLMPKTFNAEGLIKAFKKINLKNKKILFPRAKKAREVLVNFLKKQGAKVDVIDVYETVGAKTFLPLLQNNIPDWIIFGSSSAVENFVKIIGVQNAGAKTFLPLRDIKIACLGPITQKTAEERGLTVNLVPLQATLQSLIDGLMSTCH